VWASVIHLSTVVIVCGNVKGLCWIMRCGGQDSAAGQDNTASLKCQQATQ
jgi:hypothetical protein